jgi:hypothetical protein
VEGLPRLDGRERTKTMTLATPEFIRRFLSHVLPTASTIRYYATCLPAARASPQLQA